MGKTPRTLTHHVLGVSLLAAAVPAAGQLPDAVIGMDMTVPRPLGEFSEHACLGWRIDGYAAFGGILAARCDYELVFQGHESTLRCFDPETVMCDPCVDESTLQTVLRATIGRESRGRDGDVLLATEALTSSVAGRPRALRRHPGVDLMDGHSAK